MEIPGTQRVDVATVTPGNNQNELFYFCFRQLTVATCLDEFLRELDGHLPGFVFSKDVLDSYERLLAEGVTAKTPLDKAKEFLQRTRDGRASDSGELGELLLYLFAKEVKGAHKLVSKIQTRGSADMTIPGRDGIFVWKDEQGQIYMLLGEAKMRPDSNDGLREAQADMNNFWTTGDLQHEINLASTHLRSELTAENADLYEAYFIDDNPLHASLKYKNIIFVGYSALALTSLIQGVLDFEGFKTSVISDLQRCFTNQSAIISSAIHPSIYCFVPFESIDAAREMFANRHALTT